MKNNNIYKENFDVIKSLNTKKFLAAQINDITQYDGSYNPEKDKAYKYLKDLKPNGIGLKDINSKIFDELAQKFETGNKAAFKCSS